MRNRRIVDLNAIRHNVRVLRGLVPESAMLMAVVKADAYGHGSAEVARASLEAGATWLAVAMADEGVALRKAGITAPILILGESDARDFELCAAYDITAAVSSVQDVCMAGEAAKNIGKRVGVHLKLDTGMGRIGVRSMEERDAVLRAMEGLNVSLTGVFTHFADADGDTDAYTDMQLARFRVLTEDLDPKVLRHCANSAAILRRMPSCAFDMVRMGIVLYGYPPVKTDADFRHCMRWESRVMYLKEVPEGSCISYGCTYVTDRPAKVATVGCGYGDGYHRACTGRAEVLLHGRRAKVIGRICMDQFMVDVTDIPQVQVGDPVILMGQDGDDCLSAEDLALWAGTISYEILLSCTSRVGRTHVGLTDGQT